MGQRPEQDQVASDPILEGGAGWGFQQEGSLQEEEGTVSPHSKADILGEFSFCCVLSAF